MWKSFENFGLQTSEKVCWEKKKKKHAQNIRSTVHRTGDLINCLLSLLDQCAVISKLYRQECCHAARLVTAARRCDHIIHLYSRQVKKNNIAPEKRHLHWLPV